MELSFYGAAGEVTGSCFLLDTGRKRVLIDCGLIQGGRREEQRNLEPFPFDPAKLDAVVLTHAHLDHSGRVPLLVKQGYKGPIYAHGATCAIASLLLEDAAHLQERDVEHDNRRRARKGLAPVEPLYGIAEVRTACKQFVPFEYHREQSVCEGVSVFARDAGHILGSASLELRIQNGSGSKTLAVSGDLGQAGTPILRDPEPIPDADLVVMESTYGGRLHRPWDETERELGEIFQNARAREGNILVPAFSIGRTQEMLYLFRRYFDEWGIGDWELFLDSPLAIKATRVYSKNSRLYDTEAKQLTAENGGLFDLPNLHMTERAEESMRINRIRNGAIIIAGSGMCTGGRIRHHLKHNVWRTGTQILIVGYQARGTLGRALVDGARHVRIWGETMRVAATVHTVGGLSAHADQQDLIEWYGAIASKPPLVLVHGEPDAQTALAEKLVASGAEVSIPNLNDSIQL